jgi:hypothetical protein
MENGTSTAVDEPTSARIGSIVDISIVAQDRYASALRSSSCRTYRFHALLEPADPDRPIALSEVRTPEASDPGLQAIRGSASARPARSNGAGGRSSHTRARSRSASVARYAGAVTVPPPPPPGLGWWRRSGHAPQGPAKARKHPGKYKFSIKINVALAENIISAALFSALQCRDVWAAPWRRQEPWSGDSLGRGSILRR